MAGIRRDVRSQSAADCGTFPATRRQARCTPRPRLRHRGTMPGRFGICFADEHLVFFRVSFYTVLRSGRPFPPFRTSLRTRLRPESLSPGVTGAATRQNRHSGGGYDYGLLRGCREILLRHRKYTENPPYLIPANKRNGVFPHDAADGIRFADPRRLQRTRTNRRRRRPVRRAGPGADTAPEVRPRPAAGQREHPPCRRVFRRRSSGAGALFASLDPGAFFNRLGRRSLCFRRTRRPPETKKANIRNNITPTRCPVVGRKIVSLHGFVFTISQ